MNNLLNQLFELKTGDIVLPAEITYVSPLILNQPAASFQSTSVTAEFNIFLKHGRRIKIKRDEFIYNKEAFDEFVQFMQSTRIVLIERMQFLGLIPVKEEGGSDE